jgi:hypothetical protein
VVSVLFLSGVLWLLVDRLKPASPIGAWSRTSASLLTLHGAAAMLMLVLLGSLLPFHVRVAWRRSQNRLTGIVMLASNAALIGTAFGLYYAGSETLRGWVSQLHSGVGLGLPALLALHVVRGRRSRLGVEPERPRGIAPVRQEP